MKILFTGGGSGGHFYPLIAVAQEINKEAKERKLLKPRLYYLSNRPYDKRLLFENEIEFKQISAGKLRRYFSVLNFFGLFKTGYGFLKSLWLVYNIFPDVIFSNGGNISFPVLLSAKVFKIPVFIHVSDVVPGRTNRWASKFARKVAVAFPGTVRYLPNAKNKIAVVGNPIRKELILPLSEGAYEFLHLDKDIPIILVLGGSGGAQAINETIVDILPELIQKYQIIHQTGRKLFTEISGRAAVALEQNKYKNRYKSFAYLNTLAMRMSAGVANLIISRAGAGSISEIAFWGLPSIIIPIPENVSNDQRENAFAYARASAAVVIEQKNLTPRLFLSEINGLMKDGAKKEKLSVNAKKFARADAAKKIAGEIIDLALEHTE